MPRRTPPAPVGFDPCGRRWRHRGPTGRQPAPTCHKVACPRNGADRPAGPPPTRNGSPRRARASRALRRDRGGAAPRAWPAGWTAGRAPPRPRARRTSPPRRRRQGRRRRRRAADGRAGRGGRRRLRREPRPAAAAHRPVAPRGVGASAREGGGRRDRRRRPAGRQGGRTAAAVAFCRRRRIGPFARVEPTPEARLKAIGALARGGFGREVAGRALRMDSRRGRGNADRGAPGVSEAEACRARVVFTRAGAWRGAVASLPLWLGMVPFGLVIGVLADARGSASPRRC